VFQGRWQDRVLRGVARPPRRCGRHRSRLHAPAVEGTTSLEHSHGCHCGLPLTRTLSSAFRIQTLVQEGAAIIAFKLVEKGAFQEEGITALLQAPGQLEGNFGTRNLQDNLSDLKAQVAANQKGAGLMRDLVSDKHIRLSVRCVAS
jgi:hypothetical protein